MTRPDPDRQVLEERAAAWMARLSAGQDAATRAAFRRWLQADPAHADAMDRVAQVWDGTGPTRRPPLRLPAPVRRPVVAGLAALAACLLLLVATPPDWLVWTRAHYDTALGETRLVLLEDGSEVRLDSGTGIDVAFGPLRRDIRLTRGQASFKVAKSRLRPFAVAADHVTVVATGTEFIVTDAGDTRVVLLEGGVELRDPAGGAALARLTPGQLALADAIHPPRIGPADLEAETAWRQGHLVFRRTSLTDALARFARYGGPPVSLGDGTAGLEVSGVFGTRDVEKFVALAAKLHGLSLTSSPDGALALSVKPGRKGA